MSIESENNNKVIDNNRMWPQIIPSTVCSCKCNQAFCTIDVNPSSMFVDHVVYHIARKFDGMVVRVETTKLNCMMHNRCKYRLSHNLELMNSIIVCYMDLQVKQSCYYIILLTNCTPCTWVNVLMLNRNRY